MTAAAYRTAHTRLRIATRVSMVTESMSVEVFLDGETN
jgi:hypothetical protein